MVQERNEKKKKLDQTDNYLKNIEAIG